MKIENIFIKCLKIKIKGGIIAHSNISLQNFCTSLKLPTSQLQGKAKLIYKCYTKTYHCVIARFCVSGIVAIYNFKLK
ncbi:hypothetical protein [Helicobacter rodentium]|uniref:hypothetical protein n=1 Tax=Helicobacter rodentium TaxID=59617 RepID=UPI0025A4F4E8|nr:hypothetical protein [Helicobacter rodentium]